MPTRKNLPRLVEVPPPIFETAQKQLEAGAEFGLFMFPPLKVLPEIGQAIAAEAKARSTPIHHLVRDLLIERFDPSISKETWHLFVVNCIGGDDITGDISKTFMVSGLAAASGKAEELVRAAITDQLPAGFTIVSADYHGTCQRDLFVEISA